MHDSEYNFIDVVSFTSRHSAFGYTDSSTNLVNSASWRCVMVYLKETVALSDIVTNKMPALEMSILQKHLVNNVLGGRWGTHRYSSLHSFYVIPEDSARGTVLPFCAFNFLLSMVRVDPNRVCDVVLVEDSDGKYHTPVCVNFHAQICLILHWYLLALVSHRTSNSAGTLGGSYALYTRALRMQTWSPSQCVCTDHGWYVPSCTGRQVRRNVRVSISGMCYLY